MIRSISILFLLLTFQLLSAQSKPVDYVNPFIGTGGHGHTFPGATTPFGMVQLSPDTRIDGSWDGCGGYHYSDSLIYGFSHTHLSGTGCSDYGDVLLMPLRNKPDFSKKHYPSSFSHKAESARAGWYEVILRDESIRAELTASTRVGFHRYTFPSNQGYLLLDLLHRDELLEGSIEQISDNRISGIRRSKAWAEDQLVYFEMEFSQKISAITGEAGNERGDTRMALSFENMNSPMLEVKVALSFATAAGAHLNLETEGKIGFDEAKKNAKEFWNTELSRIEITGGKEEQRSVFYTALYHTLIQPNTVSDVDGTYRGIDKLIYKTDGHPYYSVFSLWDTFRAAHPLYTILYPERTRDFIRTFLLMYKQGGRLPVWELASNETDCMIGYHSVSVIADAWFKGIRGFDTQLALEAMQESATWNHLGIPEYMDHGFLSVDDEHESVSKTLEYAYDDWCIARFAEEMYQPTIFKNYAIRSKNWMNVFDPLTGFMRPKKNGAWLEPFDPRQVNNHFTEANSWQYSFFVPQDIYGLAQAHGGQDALIKKLNTLFETDSKTTGRTQSDITGLIGQYAQGNEPSHHMAWMFSVLGEPKLTQQYVRRILSEMYHNAPDGLSGNEDCGQMSAWYVFAAMGFYPICPGNPNYVVGAPLFDEIRIKPVNGKLFSIKAPGAGKSNYTATVEGKTNFWFNHSSITNGESIALNMGSKAPAKQILQQAPFSLDWSTIKTVPVPVFSTSQQVFRDSLIVNIVSVDPAAKVYYTTNGEAPTRQSILAKGPINIQNSSTLKAIAVKDSVQSPVTTANYHKIPHNWTVKILSTYNPQYTAGGDQGIIDGLFGDENWRKGDWQGYQGQDFECVVDLQKVSLVSEVGASFLQDTRSWILFPKQVSFEYSLDGISYQPYQTIQNTIDPKDNTVQLKKFDYGLSASTPSGSEPKVAPVSTPMRYLRVIAKNFGVLPAWHQGAGGEAFIFIDEIWAN